MKNILITGANSYVGTSFENWLSQWPEKYHVDTIDMIDGTWKEKSFEGYDAIFHVAGIAHVSADPSKKDQYYRINRDLAIETAQRAKRDGARQFIFMSSMIVYGADEPVGKEKIITKDTKPAPADFYGDSKLQADLAIQKLSGENFAVSIMRPPVIYGPGCKGNFPKLLKLSKYAFIFPDIDNRRSMIYIDNFCECVRQIIDETIGGIFFPQNEEYVSTKDVIVKARKLAGHGTLLLPCPKFVLNLLSQNRIFNKAFGSKIYEHNIQPRLIDCCEFAFSESLAISMIINNPENNTRSFIFNNKPNVDELVSIITPTYNCGKYISETVESVLKQTYENWELIIVDDCSSDNTKEVIAPYLKKDARIKYYRLEKNSGAAAARNFAMNIAKGRYMAFLDSDDLWIPTKLTKQIHYMEHGGCAFSCTSYEFIDETGEKLHKVRNAVLKADYNKVLHVCPGNSTVVYDVAKMGKFRVPNIKKRNDYALWLQMLKHEKYIYGIDEILMQYRVRQLSLSQKKLPLIKFHWQVYRNIEHLSICRSAYLVVYWCITKILKLK